MRKGRRSKVKALGEYFPDPHPFKKVIRKRKIRLWYLRQLTGVSETKLSRCLNSREPMPYWLEIQLGQLLGLFDYPSVKESSEQPSVLEILDRSYSNRQKTSKESNSEE